MNISARPTVKNLFAYVTDSDSVPNTGDRSPKIKEELERIQPNASQNDDEDRLHGPRLWGICDDSKSALHGGFFDAKRPFHFQERVRRGEISQRS